MRIAVVTTNIKGGMVQYTDKVSKLLISRQVLSCAFFPEGAQSELAQPTCKSFEKAIITTPYSKRIRTVSQEIKAEHPDYVWFTDNTVFSFQLLRNICRSTKTIMTVHDPAPHPTNKKSIKTKAYFKFRSIVYKIALKKADLIISLSQSAKNDMERLYPFVADKTYLMPLGAHVPDAGMIKPKAFADTSLDAGFLLFFGRIDKYKGIGRLLEAYQRMQNNSIPLVIAGQGEFSERERQLLQDLNHVYVLNEFVSDGATKWLFENATVLILPYIEASQSGIIPIAYHYNKPVIVSNLPGLAQVVIDGDTGIICNNVDDFAEAMQKIQNEKLRNEMSPKIADYYAKYFDWESMMTDLLDFLEKKEAL